MTEREHPDDLGRRLSEWLADQTPPPTLTQAAAAMGASVLAVAEAVGGHYWLFLDGDLSGADTCTVEAEGE